MATTEHDLSGRVSSGVLDRLLDDELAFDTRFGRGFSNHLAMGLVALAHFGAPDDRLVDAFAGYEAHDARPRPQPDNLARVRDEVSRNGIDATVRAHAPSFVDAPASAFFHSMIRLAYALDAGHAGQVAGALDDWTSRGTALPAGLPRRGNRRLSEVFASLRDDPDVAAYRGSGMAEVAAFSTFQATVDDIAVDSRTVDDIADAVLAVHIAADDFGTLHMVTGTHAAGVVAARLAPADADRLLVRTAQAMAAGYVAGGMPEPPSKIELDALRNPTLPAWDTIGARAAATSDVHVTKLAYSCHAQHTRTGDELYRYVAARAVGLA